MSLAPESRTLLTDALQPPAGFRLDVAVATTYSVDLVALLLAPLSFAVHEHATDLETADPIAVLESVRRHADHLTVFCQAAAIHPTPYRSVLTFIEDSVVEVTAPREGALFHPKVWAIRFRSDDGATRHRCLVLSRNLTFDQSWDTILVLDEPAPGEWTKTIDGAPLGGFVAELQSLAVRPLSAERRAEIADLAATIGAARLTVPAPYRAGEIVPLGMAGSEALALDPSDRLLAISPFLGSRVVDDLQASTGEFILLSRPTALNGVRLAAHAQPFVLDQATEEAPDASAGAGAGADASEQGDPAPVAPASEANPPARGLHAKTFLAERRDEVEVITGSANATTSAFDGNVELVVRLRGAKAAAGIDTVWHGSKEAPGLRQVCVPYTPQAPDPLVAELEDRSWEIDRWHTQLSTSDPVLEVGESDGRTTTLTLRIDASTPPEGCVTRMRPLSLLESVEARDLAPEITWGPISIRNVTPFLAVTTTSGTGKTAVTRTSVIKAELCGDVGERRQSALREVLKSATDVLRYLVFLLGDPASTVTSDLESMLGGPWHRNEYPGAWDRVNIFEPLIRAAASGDRSVDRVASLLEELGADAAHEDLIPPEFAELWAVVDELRRDDGGREAGR